MIPEAHKQVMESEEYVEEIILPLAMIAGKMIYSRYFSREAKKCTDRSGFIRSRCITRARIAGMAAQVKELTRHKDDCITKKYKQKCSDSIEKKIRELTSKRHRLAIKLIGFNYKERMKKRKEQERKHK